MEEGFVYIGRLIDHKGDYVTNYHKLGKSFDFKVRETNLNSTHMPLDVQFIRVFRTKHMSSLEKILHTCFDGYRVIKEYGWRRNITTEWFDVNDEESFENKVDIVTKYFPDTDEVDLVQQLKSDTTTSYHQKTTLMNNLTESKKKWKLIVKLNDLDISEKVAAETFLNAFAYIGGKVGYDKLVEDEIYFSDNLDKLASKYTEGVASTIKELDGYYVLTNLSNTRKADIINGMITRYGIKEMTCEVKEVTSLLEEHGLKKEDFLDPNGLFGN